MTAAIGLGSNLGHREDALLLAARLLSTHLESPRLSSPYSTAALCDSDQPRFLNAVLLGRTRLDPESLLAIAKGLEWLAGRRLGPRNGPRPLDVDLLLYGERLIRRPELEIPHPRLRQRHFVLAPLAEIAPELPIPPDGALVIDLLRSLEDDQDVRRSTWHRADF